MIPAVETMGLVEAARKELHLLHNGLADLLGVHRRTLTRWYNAGAGPMPEQLQILATQVWPRNPDLARLLAAAVGTTVEAWGLVIAAPAAAVAAPVRPPTARPEHVETVVYAAATAADLSPRAVRPAVAAALRRSLALGVDLASLVELLDPQAKPTEPKP